MSQPKFKRFWWECTDRDRAWSAATVDKPRLSWTNKFYFVIRLPGIWYWHLMPSPQSCTEALLIESGLSLPFAFCYKKRRFLRRTPLPPQMIRIHATFYVRWHVYWNLLSLFRGFGLFVTAGGQTAASLDGSIVDHTQPASAHTPKP